MNHDTQPVDQSLSAIAVQGMKTRTKGKGVGNCHLGEITNCHIQS